MAGDLLYAFVKAAAYMGWCGYGAHLHGLRGRLILRGVIFGLLRLVLGLVLGLGIILALVNLAARPGTGGVVLYLAVYIPVRWGEWSVLAWLMRIGKGTAVDLVVGTDRTTRLWRLGGIAISCLADIPVIAASGGLPLGRFLC